MGNWKVPLTLAGLGGVGAILLTSRGRKLIRSAAERFGQTPEKLQEWSDTALDELSKIQQALNELERSLGTHTAH